MKNNFINFDHLKDVNSGYFKHMYMALYLSSLVFLSSIIGFIHAIFPFLLPFAPYHLAKKAIDEAEKYFDKK
jgi:hypothetical protein